MNMTHTLPPLPFDPTQLGSFCSKETFEYHHGKHHNTYVTKLNEAITANPSYQELSLEEAIKKSHQEGLKAIYNNAAQHFNHSFFWNCMSPNGGQPGEKISALITRDFGSMEAFKEKFAAAALTLFGSGWAWLAQNPADGKLEIIQMKDADTPLILDKKPILTLDVWEHAYYIDHRNVRANFIAEFWKFTNWSYAEQQLS